ncbi:12953_t:CDS:2 [Cetraspora pellucida]|uniref:12953_t:CDS:1 n=1 Tax=Cetraspora pellucida TaxID=1433469 RepID=A0ACA9KNT7_9GLOM|nr:12953_t:CDS:2 [Cetraspora pellucida]
MKFTIPVGELVGDKIMYFEMRIDGLDKLRKIWQILLMQHPRVLEDTLHKRKVDPDINKIRYLVEQTFQALHN